MKNRDSLIATTASDFPAITRVAISTLQVNLGYRCNLSCTHCHVNAGPSRSEMMDRETIELVLSVLRARDVQVLDLTGGAPELHPQFRWLVSEARKQGVEVIDRCNLTVLFEPGQEGLADFLAQHNVRVVASLPCYLESNVDSQRGKGTYGKSIAAIRKLNALGYGGGKGRVLDLVYNPTGPFLPPAQAALEADYKRELAARFDITFDNLVVITNMPISRFGAVLEANDEFDTYMQLLRANFSADNVPGVMCRSLVSVDYQGQLFDCDFNQMLGLPFGASPNAHLRDLLEADVTGAAVTVADHCYGCTAGQGSSCGGALSA